MKLAIFDFDGTLFPVQTIPFLIQQYPKLGYSRLRQLSVYAKMIGPMVRYKILKTVDKEAFRKEAVYIFLALFENMTEADVKAYFVGNVTTVLDLLDQTIVQEAIRLKAEGYHTVLLSGCFDMLLEPLGQKIGFDEIIGTHLLFEKKVDGQNLFTAKTVVDVITGDRKAQEAQSIRTPEPIDWAESIAYADSYYDRDILELVGHKVGVNPDERLEAICQKEGWQILTT